MLDLDISYTYIYLLTAKRDISFPMSRITLLYLFFPFYIYVLREKLKRTDPTQKNILAQNINVKATML